MHALVLVLAYHFLLTQYNFLVQTMSTAFLAQGERKFGWLDLVEAVVNAADVMVEAWTNSLRAPMGMFVRMLNLVHASLLGLHSPPHLA